VLWSAGEELGEGGRTQGAADPPGEPGGFGLRFDPRALDRARRPPAVGQELEQRLPVLGGCRRTSDSVALLSPRLTSCCSALLPSLPLGEGDGASGVLLGHAGALVGLPVGLHEAASAGGVEGASAGVGAAGGTAERERVSPKNPAHGSTMPWGACSCPVRGSSMKAYWT
jgi:hypothetical protein